MLVNDYECLLKLMNVHEIFEQLELYYVTKLDLCLQVFETLEEYHKFRRNIKDENQIVYDVIVAIFIKMKLKQF